MNTNIDTTVSPAQLKILSALSTYYYLDLSQIVLASGYAPTSATHCQEHLKKLTEKGLVYRTEIPDITKGQKSFRYMISPSGWKKVTDKEPPRLNQEEFKALELPGIKHNLTLNDVLISAQQFARQSTDISLEEMQHDFEIARHRADVKFYATLEDGDKKEITVNINPDAYLMFSLQLAQAKKKLYKSLIIELDRGTQTSHINQNKLRRKMAAYVHYAMPGGEYQKQFGADTITIAYITSAGENRRKVLQSWCEAELQKQNLKEYGSIFRFLSLPDDYTRATLPGLDPTYLWGSPSAYKIGQSSPSHLLWKP